MSGVLLVTAAAGLPREELQRLAPPHRVIEIPTLGEGDIAATLGEDRRHVRAILGASPADALAGFPGLDWVHSSAAGVDGWLRGGAVPPGVTLTSAAGNGAIPLAEHALMLMLLLSREAGRWFEAQRRHEWQRFVHGELAGARLGIIGYGNSGQDLARKALACHMSVQALRRTPSGDQDGEVRLRYGDDGLRTLLRTSDVVVVTAPKTAETAGMLGAEMLALMPSRAFLITVSRGGIVDEEALVAALREGRLAGAGLDAHAVEPLPADSPLWDLPNVIVTPHNGATTEGTAARGRVIALDNVARWAAGEPLRNVVDPARGY